jgi:hypothetical protein
MKLIKMALVSSTLLSAVVGLSGCSSPSAHSQSASQLAQATSYLHSKKGAACTVVYGRGGRVDSASGTLKEVTSGWVVIDNVSVRILKTDIKGKLTDTVVKHEYWIPNDCIVRVQFKAE